MDKQLALAVFGGLAQSTRFDTFKLLMTTGPDGMSAGDIARKLDVPQNTMSTHLAVLARAGLVTSERRSQSIIYRADRNMLQALTAFLSVECRVCAGAKRGDENASGD